MELRAQKPLEKIKVKELCDLACINKSTFYAHYQDIYALANAMEDEMVEEVVESLPQLTARDVSERTEWLTPGKCSGRYPESDRDRHSVFRLPSGAVHQPRGSCNEQMHLGRADPVV